MPNCLYCCKKLVQRLVRGRLVPIKYCIDKCRERDRARNVLRDRALITQGVLSTHDLPSGLWVEVDRYGRLLPCRSQVPIFAVVKHDTSVTSTLEAAFAVEMQKARPS